MRTGTAVRLPAGGREPDLSVPDDVEDAEPDGVTHQEGHQVVAVLAGVLVVPGGEAAVLQGPVTGPALGMLERAAVAVTADEALEAGLARFLVHVVGPRGDAAARGRIVDVAGLRAEL